MASSKLAAHVLNLVQNRSRQLTYKQINKDTNISVTWLKRFGAGKIPNPCIDQIEILYEYFTQTALEFTC